MKIDFHLYSADPSCKNCINLSRKMDQDKKTPGYCFIVSAQVEDNYLCSFYRMKPLKKESTAVDSTGKIITTENPRKPKKL